MEISSRTQTIAGGGSATKQFLSLGHSALRRLRNPFCLKGHLLLVSGARPVFREAPRFRMDHLFSPAASAARLTRRICIGKLADFEWGAEPHLGTPKWIRSDWTITKRNWRHDAKNWCAPSPARNRKAARLTKTPRWTWPTRLRTPTLRSSFLVRLTMTGRCLHWSIRL